MADASRWWYSGNLFLYPRQGSHWWIAPSSLRHYGLRAPWVSKAASLCSSSRSNSRARQIGTPYAPNSMAARSSFISASSPRWLIPGLPPWRSLGSWIFAETHKRSPVAIRGNDHFRLHVFLQRVEVNDQTICLTDIHDGSDMVITGFPSHCALRDSRLANRAGYQ